MTLQMIPLTSLKPSAANVRKTDRDAGLDELIASIRGHGLINPLLVRAVPAAKKQEGHWEVIAGNRRLAALLTIHDGAEETPQIPCNVAETSAHEDREELSLAENLVREAMHPVDEYEAFAKLVEAGKSTDEIARRFGIETVRVERRMALGSLAPEVRKAWRAGKIDDRTARAYTLLTPAEQKKALKADKRAWDIQREFASKRIPIENALPGVLDTYRGNGGHIDRDLFPENNGARETSGQWFADKALFWKLQDVAIDHMANELRAAGWGVVEIMKGDRSYYTAPKGFETAYQRADKMAKNKRGGAARIIRVRDDGQTELLDDAYYSVEQAKAAKKAEKVKEAKAKAKAAGKDPESVVEEAEPDDAAGDWKGAQVTRMHAWASGALRQAIADHADGRLWSMRLAVWQIVTSSRWRSEGLAFAAHWSIPKGEADRDTKEQIRTLSWDRIREFTLERCADIIGAHAVDGAGLGTQHAPGLPAWSPELWDIAQGVAFSVRNEWTPDEAFWTQATKGQMLDCVEAIAGEQIRKQWSSCKAGELRDRMVRLFTDPAAGAKWMGVSSISEDEFARRVEGWLPAPMALPVERPTSVARHAGPEPGEGDGLDTDEHALADHDQAMEEGAAAAE